MGAAFLAVFAVEPHAKVASTNRLTAMRILDCPETGLVFIRFSLRFLVQACRSPVHRQQPNVRMYYTTIRAFGQENYGIFHKGG